MKYNIYNIYIYMLKFSSIVENGDKSTKQRKDERIN